MNYSYLNSLMSAVFVVTGIAIQSAEASLLVASVRSGDILQYDEETGDFISTLIPKGTGGLERPVTLDIGPDKNLYVADLGNNSVLRFNVETGEFIDTFVAPGSGGLNGIEGLKFGPDNKFFYVSGFEGDGIRRYDARTGDFIDIVVDTVPSTGNELNSAELVFRDDSSLFFGAILPTAGILKQDLDTNTTTTFISADNSPSVPGGLTFGPDGNLYVNDFSPLGSVSRYDGLTGEFIDTFVSPGSGGLNGAARLTFNDKFLYVTSANTNSVLRYDADTGDFVDPFVPSGSGGLNGAAGLVFVPESVVEPGLGLSTIFLGIYFSSNLLRKKRYSKT